VPASGESQILPSPTENVSRRASILEAENIALREQIAAATSGGAIVLDDDQILQEVGIYRYYHPLENAARIQR
jgi:hypothetical protein